VLFLLIELLGKSEPIYPINSKLADFGYHRQSLASTI
jgi:hypothetical protein